MDTEHDHAPHADLQDLARRHLWMHFTRLGAFAEADVPIIARGEGCHVELTDGRRWLDGLAGLFVVQAGHGRGELAEVAAAQAGRLAYFPVWSAAHEPAIRLAARLADLAPGNLDRVFFTAGGSEAVESAWKLARAYFKAIGQPLRTKAISRRTSYHGTTMGALSISGLTAIRSTFEPLVPAVHHAATTNRFRHPLAGDESAFSRWAADSVADAIEAAGPETVAAVFVEPVQNAGGCFTPPEGYFERVREICDHHGVLLVSDEVICAFGRLGSMFGCERYGYLPDIITLAKGLTSGYSPLGAVIAREHLVEPFLAPGAAFAHGLTFAGHPVSCAVALANLDIFDSEDLLGNVTGHEDGFRKRLEDLRDLPVVGDVRGAGYFWAIELVRDQATSARFTRPEVEDLLRGFLAPRLADLGLYCRVDDRGDPVVQLSPPLVARDAELDEIATILRTALGEASDRVAS